MNIGILGSRGYPSTYGGFETLVRRLAPHLVERGHDVSVYCRDDRRRVRWHSTAVDEVRQIFTPGIDSKSLSTLSYGLTAGVDTIGRDFDSLLVLNVANGFFLPAMKARCDRVVVNVDGVEWERDKWSPLGKRMFRRGAALTARWADDLIVDSEAIGDVWEQRFGRRGTFIPYGADIHDDRPTTRIEGLGLTPDSYVLVVARLVPENNVGAVLDALDRLPPDTPAVIVGAAAGPDDPTEHRLRALVAQRPSVRWLGHVADQELLTDLWFHCRVYVHGHSVGGTNPALLQAMGCGAPVVAFDSPFNREVLSEAGNFFRDVGGLVSALEGHFSDDAEQADSEALREVVRKRYSWEGCLGNYEASVTGGRPGLGKIS